MDGRPSDRIVAGLTPALVLALALVPALPTGRAGAAPRLAAQPLAGTVSARVFPPPPVPLPVPRPEEDGPPAPPSAGGRHTPAPAPALPSRREAFGPESPKGGLPRPALSKPEPSKPALPELAPPGPDPVCDRLMRGGDVVARLAAPVFGPEGCGIAAPVTLDAVVLRDGRHVALVPPALMRCDLAEAVAGWLRDGVAPATAGEGPLLGVANAAAYACRGRNRIAGARLSEHAQGNAIDILAFRFARRVIGLRAGDAHASLAAIKASACARFSTVLGPGSDAFHETDLHLDLARRRGGFKLCQWDVP